MTRHELIKEINGVSDNCCHCIEAVRGAWIERVLSHDYEQRKRLKELYEFLHATQAMITEILPDLRRQDRGHYLAIIELEELSTKIDVLTNKGD